MTGSRPTNSGMRPNLSRSSGISCSRMRSRLTLSICASEPKPIVLRPTRSSMIFSSPSNAPPQMNSTLVVSIWMKSWWGCLRPPWGGTLASVPSRIFEQALLDPLAGHVAGDRRVVRLARDLVDLVDVDDAPLGACHIEVGRLDEAQQDVLDVLADVAGLRQRGGVRDAERHVQDLAPASAPGASCRSRWDRRASRSTSGARRRRPGCRR